MGTSYNPQIATANLVFSIDPANPKSYAGSGNVVNDLITGGRTVTLIDTQPTYSITQAEGLGSFTFDGITGRGHVSNSASFSRIAWTPNGTVGKSEITLECWVKTSDTLGQIISRPWNGNGDYNFYMGPGSFTLGANTASAINYSTTLATGTWMHACCWANSTTMGYNINGNQATGSKSHLITGDTPPTAGDLGLPVTLMSLYPYSSGWAGVTSFSIAGSLGNVKIYERVLSQTEILRNFNALRGRYGV